MNQNGEGRKFKDPDIRSIQKKHRFIQILGLIGVVIASLFLYFMLFNGGEPLGLENKTSTNPDYVKVDYIDNHFLVNFSNSTASLVTVGVNVVDNGYILPREVCLFTRSGEFEMVIPDRGWGHEYLIIVSEDRIDSVFRYYYVVSKTQIGYTTVRSI